MKKRPEDDGVLMVSLIVITILSLVQITRQTLTDLSDIGIEWWMVALGLLYLVGLASFLKFVGFFRHY